MSRAVPTSSQLLLSFYVSTVATPRYHTVYHIYVRFFSSRALSPAPLTARAEKRESIASGIQLPLSHIPRLSSILSIAEKMPRSHSSEDDQDPRFGLGRPLPSFPSPNAPPDSSDESLPSSSDEEHQSANTGVPASFGGTKARTRKRRRLNTEIPFPAFSQSNPTDTANWERHTRGIASKILAKHGFTGRLGKGAHGISAPIEPVFLPDKAGLGSTIPIKQQTHSQPKKKSRSNVQKRQTKKAHPAPLKVIDMRHEIPLQVNSIADAIKNDAQQVHRPVWEEKPAHIEPRIINNLRMLADTARSESAELSRKKRAETLILQSIRAERETVLSDVEETTKARQSLQTLQKALDTLAKANQINDCAVFETVIRQLLTLHLAFTKSPYINQNAILAALVEAVSTRIEASFSSCLKRSVESATADKRAARHMHTLLAIAQKALGQEEYIKVCTRSVLMPSRRHMSRADWDVVSGACLGDVLTTMRPVLPGPLLDTLAEQILVPKLVAHVRKLNGTRFVFVEVDTNQKRPFDSIPAHVWIHPWLPVVGGKALTEVLQKVRIDLTKSLQNWQLTDSHDKRKKLIAVTKLWSEVLSRRKLQVALSRHISSKLVSALAAVKSKPSKSAHTAAVFECIDSWTDVCSTRLLASELLSALMQGPGCMLQQIAFSEGGWDEARSMYIEWSGAFPHRLMENMRPALAALLFVLQTAKAIQDKRTRDLLRRADMKVLLKNRFAVEQKQKSTNNHPQARKNETSRGDKGKARLSDVVALVAQREELPLLGLSDEGGMPAFKLGNIKVVANTREGVLSVGGRAVNVDELIVLAKGR